MMDPIRGILILLHRSGRPSNLMYLLRLDLPKRVVPIEDGSPGEKPSFGTRCGPTPKIRRIGA